MLEKLADFEEASYTFSKEIENPFLEHFERKNFVCGLVGFLGRYF